MRLDCSATSYQPWASASPELQACDGRGAKEKKKKKETWDMPESSSASPELQANDGRWAKKKKKETWDSSGSSAGCCCSLHLAQSGDPMCAWAKGVTGYKLAACQARCSRSQSCLPIGVMGRPAACEARHSRSKSRLPIWVMESPESSLPLYAALQGPQRAPSTCRCPSGAARAPFRRRPRCGPACSHPPL
jgi:hypothetical protein